MTVRDFMVYMREALQNGDLTLDSDVYAYVENERKEVTDIHADRRGLEIICKE